MRRLGVVAVVLLVIGAEYRPAQSPSAKSWQGCTGAQTVTAHHGDTLAGLVDTNVSGSYATKRIVDTVVARNGIANRNVIYAHRQYRFPTSCGTS
ncbi:MAG TPA: hypothetical protein VE442_20865 [Jatrophihabitans sp.]|jgi:hypothetical protein|nr:hypothetical protein [Jatrophihabitans sp.]